MVPRRTAFSVFLAMVCLHVPASAQPAVPAPPGQTVEISLQDPRSPQSKSYLDLDTGRTFSFGESKPENFAESVLVSAE